MHPFAQFVSILLPTTLTSSAMKDMMVKGLTTNAPSILIGFLTSFVWILLLTVLVVVTLMKKKYFVFK
jgi:hypothetical protein